MPDKILPHLDAQDCKRIARSLEEHRCVLVIGPHVNWRASDESDAQRLATRLLQADGMADSDASFSQDPALVADQFLLQRPRERYRLNEEVVEHYEGIEESLDETAAWLMDQPFPVVISTSLDPALFEHFKKTWPDGQQAWTGSGSPQRLNEPSHDQPIFYSLFGRAEYLHEDSLILTTEDRLGLMKSLVSGERVLPAALEHAVRDPSRVFLFVGFGFEQWFTRMLLHTLLGEDRVANTPRPSYAVESTTFIEHSDGQATALFFEDRHVVKFRSNDLSTLREQASVHVPSRPPRVVPAESRRESPVVFLSYRRADEERVDALRQTLEEAGIRCWQDTEKLRGGHRWSEVIRREIGSRADFFVLVQSQSLANSEKSVVFEELALAQERDRRRNPEKPGSFIIPVEIDPNAHLRNTLGNLHCVDLTQAASYPALADDILARLNVESVA